MRMSQSEFVWCREDVIKLLQQHVPESNLGIRSLALFGSVARNEATQESDLDFMVDFEGAVTFDRYMELKIFLEDLFGKQIDLAMKDSIKPQIRQRIYEEAIDVA
jgi:uncharacterized protein